MYTLKIIYFSKKDHYIFLVKKIFYYNFLNKNNRMIDYFIFDKKFIKNELYFKRYEFF